ncbi:MAG: hypothetical protein H6867_02035 [Rhodospirillales bacterium]|nr:hypothetical protein [Rhodospirillales bacterium]MCB9996967.1 hypothetical protein [Rhodospirillales bacterium]
MRFLQCAARRMVLLFVMLGLLIMPAAQIARASHLDAPVLGNADGALDSKPHVNGIYRAMRDNWLAAWMMMTEQFVSVMMQQMFIVGTFLDAKQQLEVQRLFQQLEAEAHKDFHPGFQMCVFATNVKSLGDADFRSWENSMMLDTIIEKREHLHAGLSTAPGIPADITHRIKMFKDIYCDLDQNNRQDELLCDGTEGPFNRMTKDVDYPRVIDNVYTIDDVNFTDGAHTDTEKDIMALSRNLYASPVFDFMPEQLINETAGQNLFMETRSIHAIRSVARRSFTNIVGQKAEGDPAEIYEVRPFMFGIVHELGVPVDELIDFLGENPSYFAQMEVLTRKIYQSPDFFTNLYDKPANVRRMGVALQAFELMQDRDRYEAALRREMLISLILELKLRHYQENVNDVLMTSISHKPDGR